MESLHLLPGRNIQPCKLSSLPSERGTMSGYTISFPLPCSDQKANTVTERTIGCGWFISRAISLKSQYSLFSSHVKLTQQKDRVAQGTRNTRAFPTEGLAWHKRPQAGRLPHFSRDAAIAQHISSQKGFHSCVLFMQHFRRGETAFYHILSHSYYCILKEKSVTSIKYKSLYFDLSGALMLSCKSSQAHEETYSSCPLTA